MQPGRIERVSVLIPVKSPGKDIQKVLAAIYAQQVPFDFEVVIVDSGSSAEELALMRGFPLTLHQIAPDEFSHGGTRNLLAQLASGEVLVYLSQDAQPASSTWLHTLVSAVVEPNVAGAYARQIPRPGADPLIKFFLAETYGTVPIRRRPLRGVQARITDIFFSNVSSAIRRDCWMRFPFRDHVVMSEDQYWAYDALRAGYEIVYEPRAAVMHSHNYSIRSVFARNRLSGASLRGLISDSRGAVVARGLRYLAGESVFLIRGGYASWLPRMLAYEAAKSAGFALGMLEAASVAPSRSLVHRIAAD